MITAGPFTCVLDQGLVQQSEHTTNVWFRLQAFLSASTQEGFLEEAGRGYSWNFSVS